MKRTINYLFVVSIFLSTLPAYGEMPETWTLQDCLDYAIEHNIQIQQSKITYQSGQEDTKQAKAQLFPSLTASITQGFVNNPSKNATTNNSYTGNYAVNANWTLFDGNQRNNALKQQKLQNQIDELNIQQDARDIRVAIVQAFMQVLYAIESVNISQKTVEVSESECNRSRNLLEAGSIAKVDLAQLESQLSSDRYQLVVAQTNLDNYKLQLKQLLELDITDEIEVVSPEIEEEDILSPLPAKEDVYAAALSVMPEMRSSKLSIDVAKLETKKTKGSYYPTISLNAGIGTGHLSGTTYTYGTQLWNQFNESIGLTVSIPIFANRNNKTALNKAKYSEVSSQLELLNTQKELLSIVEGYYLDATSAQTQYRSSKEKLVYVSQSYDLTQQQFFLGMKNTVELLTEKNNYLVAQQEVLQSKYMALMSIELLNIYQDKPISWNIEQ